MLVIDLAILLQLTPTSAAEGSSDRSAADAMAAIGAPLSGPGDSMQAAELTTYTVSLPLIFNNYRSVTGPFGVHSWNAPPIVISRMSEMGTAWVRLPLTWSWIEPVNTTPENYAWPAGFEQQLADLSANGIKVILLFGGNPSWAATWAGGPIDKVDISELTEFMQAAVARYSQPPYNVKYWEIYNEPDNGNDVYAGFGFGYFGHTPQAYVDVLEAVYQPIKAVDPEAKVLLGGLAYDNWEPGGPFVQDFLDQVLIRDGDLYFDLMNFHYYPAFRYVWEPHGPDIIGKATFLRQKLADEYGVNKLFICTEASMWSAPPEHGGSDELQSRYVAQVFSRSMAADLVSLIWFMLIDDPDSYAWKYGLLNPDLTPKPAYFAYQTSSAQLSSAVYARTLGPTETGSDQMEAYEFVKPGGLSIIAAWTNDDATHVLELQAPQITVVDKIGSETTVYDGDDGLVDGRVHVSIGPSPVYLRRAGGVRK